MSSKSGESPPRSPVDQVISDQKTEIQQGWVRELLESGPTSQIDRPTLDDICAGLLDHLIGIVSVGLPSSKRDLTPEMRSLLCGISGNFAERGFTPSQTATFVFSLKHQLYPLFAASPPVQQALSDLIDRMGLFSMDAFIERREQILLRQTQELLDISVPVVPLWEGILSLPIIGTLDSGRAQAITEKLLFELARTNSRHAILDISGVPTVDTLTAQYLGKTVAAARLMGAECLITGIKPAIAQVMVALGINLGSIETRYSLAEGLRYCFAQQGLTVKRQEA